MATRLMFAAPTILQKFSDKFWYPHLVEFDPTKQRWTLLKDQHKLLPFYIVNFALILGISVGSIAAQLIKYFVFHNRTISKLVAFIFVGLIFLSVFGWGFNLPTIRNGKSMIAYINALLEFQEKTKPVKIKPPKRIISVSTKHSITTNIRKLTAGTYTLI